MDELYKNYNLIPIDIKNNETLKSKIISLLNTKDLINITLKEKESCGLFIKSLKKNISIIKSKFRRIYNF